MFFASWFTTTRGVARRSVLVRAFPLWFLMCCPVLADDLSQIARGILSNRCFACHGPDEQNRESGLRLDDLSSMQAEADSGEIPIVPGDKEASELFRRITTTDDSMRMPPEHFGARLTDQETEVIGQWIESGAALPQHWSFVPPVRPDIPVSRLHASAGADDDKLALPSPIDAFAYEKLSSHGLSFSPYAPREQILRRLSLDLTGLPPTVEEVRDFLNDDVPGAYERQVDRLLASPAYGEHWARKWLDLARYADSAGYADDPPRTIWAYRDWVIDALNDNMSIDAFTRKQLAGDLLDSPTEGDLIATAFHRNTMTNSEGGTNDEEFRNAAVVDRVNTTMAVWMGVTMGCAQCHTHKYDPFTHEEYYKLFAIFNSTADADRRDEQPVLELYTPNQKTQQRLVEQDIRQLEEHLSEPDSSSQIAFEAWRASLAPPTWHLLEPISFTANSKSEAEFRDQAIRVRPTNANLLQDNFTVRLSVPEGIHRLEALELETLPVAELGGAGLVGNFVVTSLEATLRPKKKVGAKARYVRIKLPGKKRILSLAEVQVFSGAENIAPQGTATQSSTAYDGPAELAIDGNTDGNYDLKSTTHTEVSDNPWWELDLGSVVDVQHVVLWNRTDNKLQSRLNGVTVQFLGDDRRLVSQSTEDKTISLSRRLTPNGARKIDFAVAISDYAQSGFAAAGVLDGDRSTGWAVGGQQDAKHRLTLVLKSPIEIEHPSDIEMVIGQESGYRNHLLSSFQVSASDDPAVSDWAGIPEHLKQAILASGNLERDREELLGYFHRWLAPNTKSVRDRLATLRAKLDGFKPATSVPVMRELRKEERRKTHIQIRGNYKSLGQEVIAGFPAVFHRCLTSQPNRLDLAEWLVDRRNPLTARVWVNRIWESLLGRGIVSTSEDFGAQGELPSHPKLLDWLAVELMESEWDQKKLIRQIVLSRVYRQSSRATPEGLEVDPENIWLARGPSGRLSAEMVRDQALAVSGLLDRSMFGESVRPPQPNQGLKAAFGGQTDWETSEGGDRYRRGLYTSWRRSNPYPSLAMFDAPSREVCTLRRDSTNTPLQALVTLNDPAFVEAAQALARDALQYPCQDNSIDEVDAKLAWAFHKSTGRDITTEELEPLRQLLSRARSHFAAEPDAAMQLATEPLGRLPEKIDAREAASWTAVCNVLLNLDELLMKH